MTSVSTVSRGTTGRYESYDCGTQSYDTDSLETGAFDASIAESEKSYEGTGVCKNRCPRDAPERMLANFKRRARRRALCGRVAVLAGEGVAA